MGRKIFVDPLRGEVLDLENDGKRIKLSMHEIQKMVRLKEAGERGATMTQLGETDRNNFWVILSRLRGKLGKNHVVKDGNRYHLVE